MAVDDTTQEVLKRFDQFTDKISALAHQYGPDVVNSALKVAQIDCIQSIIMWLSCVSILPLAVWGVLYTYKQAKAGGGYSDWTPVCFLTFLACAVYSVALILTFDIWYWVGLFEPKLYLAHKIFSL